MVTMVQALAKHMEALPDELHETTIRGYKRLCHSCGCHNERELAAALTKERRPLACPLARLLRAKAADYKCQSSSQLASPWEWQVSQDTSWQALLMHLSRYQLAGAAHAPAAQGVGPGGLTQVWLRM